MTVEWNPDCVAGDNPSGLAEVDSPALRQLESEVFEYLKNSWCSEQKAKLLLELVVITKPERLRRSRRVHRLRHAAVLAGLRTSRRRDGLGRRSRGPPKKRSGACRRTM